MYCTNCGNKLDGDVRFCPSCGQKIKADSNICESALSTNEGIASGSKNAVTYNSSSTEKVTAGTSQSNALKDENFNNNVCEKPDSVVDAIKKSISDSIAPAVKETVNNSFLLKLKRFYSEKKPLFVVIISALAFCFIIAVSGSLADRKRDADKLPSYSVNLTTVKSSAKAKETTEKQTEPETTETTAEATTGTTIPPTTEKSLAKGKIELTNDSFYGNHKEVISELKEMGFTNVTKKAIYDCDSGWWDSVDIGRTEKVVIAGKEKYDAGDVFNKKDKVVVYYHEYIYDDPDIEYDSVTVKKLDDDMEKNAITAEEKYKGKYFAVTGYVDEIDSKSITLTPDGSGWSLYVVRAEIKTDEQLAEAKKLSSGNMITVKGKITEARSSIGSSYSMDIYQIVL